ncbi:MAG: GIY-YIG nuclease family protein [Rhodospirillales bacterium]|jgi:predicted GIY-YIG superfamily endonuclease|nr:GIY-YIG nuclease family protein [Rhodospirillales bacterium]
MPQFAKLGHCVYVLFSEADGKLYIGYSSNLKQRLSELKAI